MELINNDYSNEDEGIRRIVRLIKTITSESITYFDVGANVGTYARNFMLNFEKGGDALLFEPNADLHDDIKNNTQLSDWNSRVIGVALGQESGTTKFNIFPNDIKDLEKGRFRDSSCLEVDPLLHEISTHYDNAESIEVILATLDNYTKKIDRINYLKVDAQGYDLNVLKGSKETLLLQKIDVVNVEFTLARQYQGQFKLHELLAYMDEVNYKLHSVLRLAHTPKGYIYFGDLCFVSTKCWNSLEFN